MSGRARLRVGEQKKSYATEFSHEANTSNACLLGREALWSVSYDLLHDQHKTNGSSHNRAATSRPGDHRDHTKQHTKAGCSAVATAHSREGDTGTRKVLPMEAQAWTQRSGGKTCRGTGTVTGLPGTCNFESSCLVGIQSFENSAITSTVCFMILRPDGRHGNPRLTFFGSKTANKVGNQNTMLQNNPHRSVSPACSAASVTTLNYSEQCPLRQSEGRVARGQSMATRGRIKFRDTHKSSAKSKKDATHDHDKIPTGQTLQPFHQSHRLGCRLSMGNHPSSNEAPSSVKETIPAKIEVPPSAKEASKPAPEVTLSKPESSKNESAKETLRAQSPEPALRSGRPGHGSPTRNTAARKANQHKKARALEVPMQVLAHATFFTQRSCKIHSDAFCFNQVWRKYGFVLLWAAVGLDLITSVLGHPFLGQAISAIFVLIYLFDHVSTLHNPIVPTCFHLLCIC